MSDSAGFGKIPIVIGAVIAIVGLLFLASDRLPFLRALGRLPGDFSWKGEGWRVHFPLATSLIISLLLSGAFWLVSYLSNRGGKG